ncbi:type 1 fimbrial adaptor subunit FimF [Serratia liquefaciens]|uniref:Type 1 fimbrial protein n=1 Tax=Serratia liquefaciens TaxID=614 RepID=A0A515D611_SERLI|nr:fimbrial protein [Serratia liquefaciens]QDL35845.1 type 1 fimbrial protein [Serratia liquefaciens]
MNKICYLLSIIGSLILSDASASDSTITISGNVKDSSCSVAGESKDFTVDLLDHNSKEFRAIGDTTSPISFRIVLESCSSSVTAVKIGFVGIADNTNTNLLKLDSGPTAASGIGIQIMDMNKNILPLNAVLTENPWITLTPGKTNMLNFYARLMATQLPVTMGDVKATATFTLEFQ